MNRNCLKQPANKHLQHRKGTLIPFVGCAILVVGCCCALVLDRLYIDAAKVELRKAAEASALASARSLVDDESLKTNPDLTTLVDHARLKGISIAAENLVAGEPLVLDDSPQGDIRFGQLLFSSELNTTIFAETDSNPHAVVVKALRHRARGNPLALFFRQLTGQPTGDAVETAEALIDNRVVELKPAEGLNIPAIPLGILAHERAPQQTLSWNTLIDNKLGLDNYGYDPVLHQVTHKADGIQEIVIKTQPQNEDEPMYNGIMLNLGNYFNAAGIGRQFTNGININDLEKFGALDFTGNLPAEGNVYQSQDEANYYEQLVGEQKIVFLVTEASSYGKNGFINVHILKPVAVRIMTVNCPSSTEIEIVLQPTKMTTRTVINPVEPLWTATGQEFTNNYIYNLKLSN